MQSKKLAVWLVLGLTATASSGLNAQSYFAAGSVARFEPIPAPSAQLAPSEIIRANINILGRVPSAAALEQRLQEQGLTRRSLETHLLGILRGPARATENLAVLRKAFRHAYGVSPSDAALADLLATEPQGFQTRVEEIYQWLSTPASADAINAQRAIIERAFRDEMNRNPTTDEMNRYLAARPILYHEMRAVLFLGK